MNKTSNTIIIFSILASIVGLIGFNFTNLPHLLLISGITLFSINIVFMITLLFLNIKGNKNVEEDLELLLNCINNGTTTSQGFASNLFQVKQKTSLAKLQETLNYFKKISENVANLSELKLDLANNNLVKVVDFLIKKTKRK